MARDALVGRKPQDADPRIDRGRRSDGHRPSFDQGFEAAETARGFHQLIGNVADADGGGGIARHDRAGEFAPPLRQIKTDWRVAGDGRLYVLHSGIRLSPTLGEHESFKRSPAFPASGLQSWPRGSLVRIAHAEPRDWYNTPRQTEQGAHVVGAVEGKPTDTDPLGTRGT